MGESYSIEGVIPVLPVPFADDQSLDLEAFVREVDWLIDRPLDGLALFGLASEYWKFNDNERITLVEVLVQTVQKRKPVVVSVTDSSRYNAVQFARRFANVGADALVVMPPHFLTPKSERMIDHCCAVADAVAPLDVIVQYSPAYVGVSLTADMLMQMHERSPNIGYVKVEPRPPGPMIDAIRNISGGRLRCLIGHGGLSLADCRHRGIVGVMPGVAVIEIYRELWSGLGCDHPSDEIMQLNEQMVAMMSHIVPSIDMWVAAEKQMLNWRGVIDRTTLREPSSQPEEKFFTYLRSCYDRLKASIEERSCI